ncbi:MAG: hypothetical protein IJU96_01370, partial [Clostridia bacterium]|nr:hypothetical protein [Clostridia bacterium]
MSSRPEITADLTAMLRKYLNPHNDTRVYIAREVTFDYYSMHPIRVDYMRFKPLNNTVSGIEHGDFYCYEVKSSIADFHSKNGHNFIGDFNYYVMQENVFEAVKPEIPYFVGVMVPSGDSWNPLKIAKKAKRRDRERPASLMLFMMWRSFARDETKEERNRERT